MNSLILRSAAAFLLPLLLLFAVFLLFRGHNEPGGGFVGGLAAAGAFVLHGMAEGPAATRRLLRADPRSLVGAGLLMALLAGLLPMLDGRTFLTGLWTVLVLPGLGEVHLGTPLLFDLGVFTCVVGMAMLVVLTLEESD